MAATGGRAIWVDSAPGRARQLNAGARRASGDIFLFLHADTWLDPAAGAALAEAFARPGVVGGCFTVVLRGPSARRPIARFLATAINARTRWLGGATGDQAIFARRTAFERIGGFPRIDLFEDVIFYRQLRRLGKVETLGPPVRTSDRRWRRHGYLRTMAAHVSLRLMLYAGVTPARLARLYDAWSGR